MSQQTVPARSLSLQSCPERLERIQSLVDYLYRIVARGLVTQDVARRAWEAWRKLSATDDSALSVPNACPGPDGQLLYTWDREEHHLELEIFPDGPSEFFYRNRAAGELWECEYAVGEPVPAEALVRLRLFA